MFDILPLVACDEHLDAVRSFFCEHGHELAGAVRRLGGAAAEARVIDFALRLETADRFDGRLRRDLLALHSLIALRAGGADDPVEIDLFIDLDPASREVETICLLTDRFEDLLQDIGEPVDDWRFPEIDDFSADIPA